MKKLKFCGFCGEKLPNVRTWVFDTSLKGTFPVIKCPKCGHRSSYSYGEKK